MPSGMGKACNNAMRGEGKWTAADGAGRDTRVPQSARDVFALLAAGGWIDTALADSLKRMVGFCNIAVHDYQALQLPITVSIITDHLDEFLRYIQAVLLRDAA